MSEIIPAIMPENFDELQDSVTAVVGAVQTVQVDIMDGKFVEGKTWPFDRHEEANFLAIVREEDGMPCWDDVDYELDLMIQHPDENFEQWIALGPKRIIVHIESLKDPLRALEEMQQYREYIQIGLSFDDEYDLEKLDQYIALIDFFQVMGIDDIGAQGQPLSERALDNVASLRARYPKMPISVDGSVNTETAQQFIESGADRLVAGSSIFARGNVHENIENLRNLIQ